MSEAFENSLRDPGLIATITGRTVHYERYVPLKSGKRSKMPWRYDRWRLWCSAPFTPFNWCVECRQPGDARWVKRWGLFPWVRYWDAAVRRHCYEKPYDPVLCMGCMNRARPIAIAQRIAEENKHIITRIEREIGVKSKDSKRRTTA